MDFWASLYVVSAACYYAVLTYLVLLLRAPTLTLTSTGQSIFVTRSAAWVAVNFVLLCVQGLCTAHPCSRQQAPQHGLLLGSSHAVSLHRHSSSSSASSGSGSAAARASKQLAAAAVAVEERIEEKELHVEASESYLAVSRYH